jgi:hypothetical protein
MYRKPQFLYIFGAKIITMEDLDDHLKQVLTDLKENGYQRALFTMKDAKMSYWKMFYDNEDKIYQIGYLFVSNRDNGLFLNLYGGPDFTFTQECHIIGDHNIFLSNNRPLSVYAFEQMALDFYNATGKYMK